jgi:hypothetical protein
MAARGSSSGVLRTLCSSSSGAAGHGQRSGQQRCARMVIAPAGQTAETGVVHTFKSVHQKRNKLG